MNKLIYSLVAMFLVISMLTQAQDNQMSITAKNSGAQGVNYNLKAPNLFYSQMNPTSTGILCQALPDYGNCAIDIADDFTVTGTAWHIDMVDVLAFNIGSGVPSFFDIFFYADQGGQPGTPVYSGLGLPYTQNGYLLSIALNVPAVLPPGNYWIEVRPTMLSTDGTWYWFVQVPPLIGNVFYWRDPCNVLGMGYPNWTPGPVAIDYIPNYDLCFALYNSNEVPLSNWAIFIGIGLILVFAIVRFRKAA
jgi:hypothetical protein